MNKQLNVTVQYLHSYEPKCIKITFGDGILACMSRDFDILDRKSTRLNSSHSAKSRMPSSA